MSWLKKLLFAKQIEPKPKPEPVKSPEVDNTYIDIIISLNKNLEIDLSVFLADDLSKINMDRASYILACAEFLNMVSSDHLKPQIISILDTQIRSKTNDQLIETILLLLEKTDKKNISINQMFIKPSQVFSKYSV
jgi:hypothetical protein